MKNCYSGKLHHFWGKKRLRMNTLFFDTYQVFISGRFFLLFPSFVLFLFLLYLDKKRFIFFKHSYSNFQTSLL